MKYRLYIDEVGNSDLKSSSDPNHRFLSLSGVIFELAYVDRVVYPQLEDLKRRYFRHHADEPVVLHRKEMMNGLYPFNCLRDPCTRDRFNGELLGLLGEFEYTVITAVIDKQEHQQRYATFRFDPYHYCVTVILERYAMWLIRRGFSGDVMAESRGGNADMRLKKVYHEIYDSGTDFMPNSDFVDALTSRELKVKGKEHNIAGLQIADVIAHPSFKATQARHDGTELAENFGGRIAEILESSKYNRSASDKKIDGWGRKWLP